ncbi:MAG: FMN-binding negative transcriptional regulator [Sphingomonadaceae bacterium]|nr:FMN-binding negative transcriptional regulator [Sphingomonadaceae bacterium]
MHPNAAFRWDDREAMRAFAVEIGFGMLFLTTPDGPRVAHVPFVFLDEDRLAFHLARGNAITKHLDGAEALFVINGPDGYISPDWYGIPDQVPTWNYVALELQGIARQMDEAALIAQADALSEANERRLAPKPVWTRDKMSDGLFDKMLRGITGFELGITAWRSTVKLGQNKSAEVRMAAAGGAEAAGNRAIAHRMRSLPAREGEG